MSDKQIDSKVMLMTINNELSIRLVCFFLMGRLCVGDKKREFLQVEPISTDSVILLQGYYIGDDISMNHLVSFMNTISFLEECVLSFF